MRGELFCLTLAVESPKELKGHLLVHVVVGVNTVESPKELKVLGSPPSCPCFQNSRIPEGIESEGSRAGHRLAGAVESPKELKAGDGRRPPPRPRGVESPKELKGQLLPGLHVPRVP